MWRWILAAIVIGLGGAAAACWEAVTAPSTRVLCGWVHPDCLGNHWLLVWVAERVAAGEGLLHNDAYYWPVGDAPWIAGNGNEGFPYLPWHLLFGWPLGSTIHLVGMLALNGVAAFALCRAAGASPAASLAAVPAATVMVYTIQELGAGRFSQVSTAWLGFFFAAWLRLLEAPSARRGLLAAALLALTSFFYWYYGFFGVIGGAVLWAFRRAPLRALWPFALAYLLMIGPYLAYFAAHQDLVPGVSELFPSAETPGDSCWPTVPFLAEAGRHAGRELAFTTTIFALLGLWRRDRPAWTWLALWAVFAGLMAGPLWPHGPYEQLYGLAAPLRRFWWPYRHVIVVNLATIVLAARGMDLIFRRPIWMILLGLSVPLQLELQRAPWHTITTQAKVPVPFYRQVGQIPGKVLVEPPLSPAIASSQAQLLYQLDHRKQLLGGHALWVDRVRPAAWDDFVAKNSFLREMQRLETAELDGSFRFEAADLQALIDEGATVFVVNSEYFPSALSQVPRIYQGLFEALFGAPVVKGKRAWAWDARAWNGRQEVGVERWTWPANLRPGGPSLSIMNPRLPSMAFSMGEVRPPPKGTGPRPAPGTGR